MLELAADAAPEVARYSYVYGVALHSSGEVERAITVLEGALERHPGSAEILQALASFHRDRGSIQEAIRYAERLVELLPQDPGARQLLQQLQ